MKKLKLGLFKTGLTALALMFYFTNSSAQKRGHDGFNLDSVPGITAELKAKIESLKDAHMKSMKTLMDQRNKAIVWDAKDSLDRQILEARISQRKEIYALLTDEQKKYFDTHQGSFGPGHRPDKGRKPGPPEPPKK